MNTHPFRKQHCNFNTLYYPSPLWAPVFLVTVPMSQCLASPQKGLFRPRRFAGPIMFLRSRPPMSASAAVSVPCYCALRLFCGRAGLRVWVCCPSSDSVPQHYPHFTPQMCKWYHVQPPGTRSGKPSSAIQIAIFRSFTSEILCSELAFIFEPKSEAI